jgi:hypothetical protein
MGNGSFPGVKQPALGINHPPRVAPRSKKEWSYTSAPHLCLHGRFTIPLPYLCADLNSLALSYKGSADTEEITNRLNEDTSKVEEKTKRSIAVTFKLREEQEKIYVIIINTGTFMIGIY